MKRCYTRDLRSLSCAAAAAFVMSGCSALASLGVPGVSSSDGDGPDDAPASAGTGYAETGDTDEASDRPQDPRVGQEELSPELDEKVSELSNVFISVRRAAEYDKETHQQPPGPRARFDEDWVDVTEGCVAMAEELLDAGVSADHYVHGRGFETENTVEYNMSTYVPLGDVPTACAGVREHVEDVYFSKLEPVVEALDLLTREYDEEAGRHPGEDVAAPNRIRDCHEVVSEAGEIFDMGPDEPIDIPGLIEMELQELELELCVRLEVVHQEYMESRDERAAQARRAELAPYEEVLSGDKWDTFWNRGMEDLRVRGRGGTILETPQDLARADLWCETLSNPNVVPEEWIVRCYHFQGNRRVDRQERTGVGSRPPSSAYR